MRIQEEAVQQLPSTCLLSQEELQAISHQAIGELCASISMGVMIVGHRAAGKGTFGTFMQHEGFLAGATSTALRNLMSKNNIEITPNSLIVYGKALKQHYGPSVLTYLTCADIVNQPARRDGQRHNILLDGPRTIEEVKGFRAMLPENHLVVAITSNPLSIWDRHETRRHETGRVDFETYEDFLEHMQGDEYLRIDDLIKHHVDMTIDNSQEGIEGLLQLQERARSLAARFGKIW